MTARILNPAKTRGHRACEQIDEECESGDIPLLREEGWLRQ